jgi:hypothetical protein
MLTQGIVSYTAGRFYPRVRCWALSLELAWIRMEVSLSFIGQAELGRIQMCLNWLPYRDRRLTFSMDMAEFC